jgi:hypothetical protein
MSPQRLRKVNAKVEGRDQPEVAKGTMETFRALTKRLLKVTQAEVAERQAEYDKTRAARHDDTSAPRPPRVAGKKNAIAAPITEPPSSQTRLPQ